MFRKCYTWQLQILEVTQMCVPWFALCIPGPGVCLLAERCASFTTSADCKLQIDVQRTKPSLTTAGNQIHSSGLFKYYTLETWNARSTENEAVPTSVSSHTRPPLPQQNAKNRPDWRLFLWSDYGEKTSQESEVFSLRTDQSCILVRTIATIHYIFLLEIVKNCPS